jgi:GNAT superfamily N-acetyltransferase
MDASVTKYPKELEMHKSLTDGTGLFFRPIKPTDEILIRNLLYACSERSIAFRFFRQIQAFPHRFIQEFTNVDLSRDMAIIALIQETGGEQIIGVGRFYLNQTTNRAELSFLVRDDWQSKGLGSDLLKILTDIALSRGITGFDANVLASNHNMLSVFYNSGYKITSKKENDVFIISYDFKEKQISADPAT